MIENTTPRPNVNEFTGSKYRRFIQSVESGEQVVVDVYCVLEAFQVHCPAIQHATKKLLCAGLRAKNNTIDDLIESRDAITRAIELEINRKKFKQ